jgi:hypothetical protein
MGREIRRVPPNWQHPVNEPCKHYMSAPQHRCPPGRCFDSMYDEAYEDAADEWLKECCEFKPNEDAKYYWDWNGNPPDKAHYRPRWREGEATWYQVYETVSEGTPVSPPFATRDELVEYLVVNGDYWDQRRGSGGWSRRSAEAFVGRWICSVHGHLRRTYCRSARCARAV